MKKSTKLRARDSIIPPLTFPPKPTPEFWAEGWLPLFLRSSHDVPVLLEASAH